MQRKLGSSTQLLLVSGGLSLAMFASPAHAVYSHLSVVHHASVNIGGTDRWVYRVYANFTDAADRGVFVAGTDQIGPLVVQSRNADDSDFGSSFFNTPGGTRAPSQADVDFNPNAQWDTFVTIGVSIADQGVPFDLTSTTPGFVPLSGNNWSMLDGGWLVSPTIDHDNDPQSPQIAPPQTIAGFAGDGDLQNRVLLMQLTVNAGDNVRGSLSLMTFQPYPSFSNTLYVAQTFNSVPGPGVLGLLATAMLRSSRRRRVPSGI